MSIPKNGAKLLRVDGALYRWRVRRRPTYHQANGWSGLNIAIEDAEHSDGSVLIVALDEKHPSNWINQDLGIHGVTPGRVAEKVRQALALGWQPRVPGRQFLLPTASEIDANPTG